MFFAAHRDQLECTRPTLQRATGPSHHSTPEAQLAQRVTDSVPPLQRTGDPFYRSKGSVTLPHPPTEPPRVADSLRARASEKSLIEKTNKASNLGRALPRGAELSRLTCLVSHT